MWQINGIQASLARSLSLSPLYHQHTVSANSMLFWEMENEIKPQRREMTDKWQLRRASLQQVFKEGKMENSKWLLVDKPLSPLLLVPVNRKQINIKNTLSSPYISAI